MTIAKTGGRSAKALSISASHPEIAHEHCECLLAARLVKEFALCSHTCDMPKNFPTMILATEEDTQDSDLARCVINYEVENSAVLGHVSQLWHDLELKR